MNKFKAVFHLDKLSKVGGVLSNISNLITEIGVETWKYRRCRECVCNKYE